MPPDEPDRKGAASHREAGTDAPPVWLKAAPVLFLLLWSGGYTGVIVALKDSEPLHLLTLRYLIVLAFLLPAALVFRPHWPRRWEDWLHLAVVGFVVQGLYFGGSSFCFRLGISAGTVAIILAMQPILIAALGPWLAGERVSLVVWFGLVLGLAGALIAILAKSGVGEVTAAGLAIAVASLGFITFGTLYEKRFGGNHHPIAANLIQCAVALAVAAPLALVFESGEIRWTTSFVAALAYLSIGNSIISMTLLLAMIRHGEAARASALFFLVPPTASLIASAVIGETMPPAAWIGMALAGAGVLVARRARS